jgi:hypothetical protein
MCQPDEFWTEIEELKDLSASLATTRLAHKRDDEELYVPSKEKKVIFCEEGYTVAAARVGDAEVWMREGSVPAAGCS